MKRPLILYSLLFSFAIIAFIAGNVKYLQWIDKVSLNRLNKTDLIMQVDSLHSKIPDNDFKKDSLLTWLPKFKDKTLINWINQHPNCKVSSAFDSNKSGDWVWAYVINDKDIVVLATIGSDKRIVTSL